MLIVIVFLSRAAIFSTLRIFAFFQRAVFVIIQPFATITVATVKICANNQTGHWVKRQIFDRYRRPSSTLSAPSELSLPADELRSSTDLFGTEMCAELIIYSDKAHVSWNSPRKEARTMVLTLPPFYPHRRNRDGSIDSICLKCLLTVASARIEADLHLHDKNHVCMPSILSQRAFDRARENGGNFS